MDILITEAELQSAPRAVREWVSATLASRLGLGRTAPESTREVSLGAATLEDAAAILDLIRNDHVASQVLFELGRDTPSMSSDPKDLHRMQLADVMHHTQLAEPQELMAALERIGDAFRQVSADDGQALFALDQAGNVYVHDKTRRAIKSLWQRIVASQYADLAEAHPKGPSVAIGNGPNVVPRG